MKKEQGYYWVVFRGTTTWMIVEVDIHGYVWTIGNDCDLRYDEIVTWGDRLVPP